MAENRIREQVVNLLGQIAQVIGAESPVQASGSTSNLSSASLNLGPRGPTTPVPVTPVVAPAVRSSVLSELRERFAPYNRREGTRITGRTGRRTAILNGQQRPWNQRCFCLGGPEDLLTPTENRRLLLVANGLGDSVLNTDQNANSNGLTRAVKQLFPLLEGADFELLRAAGGGRSKPLTRISNNEAVPPVQYIKAARIGILFIRPFVSLTLADINGGDQENNAGANDEVVPIDSESTPRIQTDNPGHSRSAGMSTVEPTPSENNPRTPTETEVITLADFRDSLYQKNEGYQYIDVQRNEFLEQVLGVYKDPDFNYAKKPKVHFHGEPGRDIGALTKEYFWKGLLSISQDKLDNRPLFEGETDHLVPSCDAKLVRSGVFLSVGKFMAHASIHCGIAFLGLSSAVGEYLLAERIDSDTPIGISMEDIVEVDTRVTLAKIRSVQDGAILSEEDCYAVRDTALRYDVSDPVTRDNASYIFDHILYQAVIERRKSPLEAMKSGFQKAGILEFVIGKSYLKEGMFPRHQDIIYPASMIIDKLESNEDDRGILNYVVEFVTSLEGDQQRLQNLLSAWTGWPEIPEAMLLLNVGHDVVFMAHACFNTVDIPSTFTKQEVLAHFNMLVDVGAAGFGAA